ncbi:hypothetical protein B0H15DRAFT_799757 [Mycena belliarum]|uniref:Uncharacterized protein n=1 Tax=Mycena belliarum TaxID=1033014 RepID=A0AAD6U5T8_9AGAR|nr:hypothetical protein B0H15DRAFT_799757 [Mycena belliae]
MDTFFSPPIASNLGPTRTERQLRLVSVWGMTPAETLRVRRALANSGARPKSPPSGARTRVRYRNGRRKLRLVPLTQAELYEGGLVPTPQPTSNEQIQCTLCGNVKAHPVK